MADTKVSGLSAVTAFAVAQEFPVNDAGTSKKISGTQLKTAFPNGVDIANGYVRITANQTAITAQVDVTSLTLTQTFTANRRIRLSTVCYVVCTTATDTLRIYLMEGATQLSYGDVVVNNTSAVFSLYVSVVFVPTAAAHTYKVQAQRAAGTGTMSVFAASNQPSFLLIEDLGPSA